LLRVPRERPVAGNPVRRALVALDPTGKQRAPAAMRAQDAAAQDSGSIFLAAVSAGSDAKKALTGTRWFGILGEFA
jgi:hypothetical protein